MLLSRACKVGQARRRSKVDSRPDGTKGKLHVSKDAARRGEAQQERSRRRRSVMVVVAAERGNAMIVAVGATRIKQLGTIGGMGRWVY